MAKATTRHQMSFLLNENALLSTEIISQGQAQTLCSIEINLISVTDSAGSSDTLERSRITDTVDPMSTITESLTRFHEFTAPADKFDYSTIQTSSPSPLLWRDNFCHLGTESLCNQSHLNKGRKRTSSPYTGASTRSCSRPGHC
jgi:hypothetical protein